MYPSRWMPTLIALLACCLASMTGPGTLRAQVGENLQARGYVQFTPVHVSAALPEPVGKGRWMEYRLQKRLNLRWDATPDLAFHWQMRTRLFAGDLIRDIPGYADGIDSDAGLVNLSWMIQTQDRWLLHYIPDRLYGEWDHGDWNIRLGRQRVNWGVNLITNPNDLFNIYSFYDFDYPERPGSDALRIQRFLGFGSRLELAASPARDLENSVAAVLYAFNAGGHDVQLIGGYYRERLATGVGWAGDVGGAGFKGELMHFADLETTDGNRSASTVAAVSVDYMFPNRLFLVAEALYNRDGGQDGFGLLADRFTPDNPSLSRWQFTAQASYPLHELLDGTLTAMVYPDKEAFFLSPALTWSALTNLDVQLLGQFFLGGTDPVLSDARIVTASLTYHF